MFGAVESGVRLLDEVALLQSGVANGNVMSVRAAAYHIAGHEMHHVNIIKELYLKRLESRT